MTIILEVDYQNGGFSKCFHKFWLRQVYKVFGVANGSGESFPCPFVLPKCTLFRGIIKVSNFPSSVFPSRGESNVFTHDEHYSILCTLGVEDERNGVARWLDRKAKISRTTKPIGRDTVWLWIDPLLAEKVLVYSPKHKIEMGIPYGS